MTHADPIFSWDEIHKKDKRTGFIVSLSIHVLLFLIGGVIFVKTAQYSVQTVPESIQVDLVQQSPPEPKVIKDIFSPKLPPPKKQEMVKLQVPKLAVPTPKVFQSSVKTEAKPDYIQNPPPEYPQLAKQMRQEGMVLLSVDVSKEGLPITVAIIKSSGHHMLDQAALKAVRHWRFKPGRIGDLPIESTVTVPIRFRLEK